MKNTLINQAMTAVHSEAQASQLHVVVPYTTPGLTRTALRYVATLGGELEVNVQIVDAHVVPFPVPVNAPTVNREFLEERLQTAAEETSLPTRAELVFTRDRLEALRRKLEPGSLVVIAARGWWWFSAERKLARSLSNAGHEVVVLSAGNRRTSAVQRLNTTAAHLGR